MAINPEDVKLYESQRLTDETDGGGRATGVEVVDGEINNLFPDISRIDRTVGDVALRKAFVGINTNNQDVYLGAHALVSERPADPRVNVVLFKATSEFDEREQAKDKIESYLAKATKAEFLLYGNQYAGQKQLAFIQQLDQKIPEVGEVFHLLDTAPNPDEEQYIRITSVEHSTQEFLYLVGGQYKSYTRRVITAGISSQLDHTFPGGDFTPTGTTSPQSIVSKTIVADAARYYGVSPLSQPVVTGDLKVNVNSVYSAVVPSAQGELAILDADAGGVKEVFYPARDTRLTITSDYNLATGLQTRPLFADRPILPGSADISYSVYTWQESDDDFGEGITFEPTGVVNNAFKNPKINDYETGDADFYSTGGGEITGVKFKFRPAAVMTGRVISGGIDITIGNRGFNYSINLASSKPKPGTLKISYRVQGNWYDIEDSGSGELTGEGVGSVNFVTGTTAVTLSELPDVGSTILYSYVFDLPNELTILTGNEPTTANEIAIQLLPGVLPGSVSITYTSGTAQTVTDDGVGGLTGDGAGTIDYAVGSIRLTPNDLPNRSTVLTVDYQNGSVVNESIAANNVGDGVCTGTLASTPILPGSVTVEVAHLYYGRRSQGNPTLAVRRIQDDGLGGWKGGYTGAINYSTGEYSVEAYKYTGHHVIRTTKTSANGGSYLSSTTNNELALDEQSGPLVFRYQTSATTHAPDQVTYDFLQHTIKIDQGTAQPLVPNSLRFTWNGDVYIDRDGIIYQSPSAVTGAATAVGSIDYQTKTMTFDAWENNSSSIISITAGATVQYSHTVDSLVFRTPGSPLRPQSVQITATAEDGTLITGDLDAGGDITGTNITGTVDVETGIISVQFTDGVDPVYVYADTMRYNAVIITYLPLDAELIGLDPVRLPSDGRVPVFKDGDVIVLNHWDDEVVGTPTSGQVVTLSRDFVAEVQVIDANGVAMDPAQYTVNKTVASVTFESPVVLQDAATNALTMPITIRNRIEHMSLASDVQINGDIYLIAPTAHDYPANETMVSSALVWGDVNSRYLDLFHQKTWNSGSPNWTSSRIGDDTTAKYNELDNPIEIYNNGAITEKWAIVFTSSTAFQVVGQTLGIIATGNTSTDCAPPNPNTGNPYFIIRSAGWGAGWASSNVIRFDTEGCLAPLWIARTVISGEATADNDKFVLQIRGDAD